jgi:hypothetical protein
MEESFKKLYSDENGYSERIKQGEEAIKVLKEWYDKLLAMGYYIKDDDLYRLSDNKDIAFIYNIENQKISVLPLLSYL